MPEKSKYPVLQVWPVKNKDVGFTYITTAWVFAIQATVYSGFVKSVREYTSSESAEKAGKKFLKHLQNT